MWRPTISFIVLATLGLMACMSTPAPAPITNPNDLATTVARLEATIAALTAPTPTSTATLAPTSNHSTTATLVPPPTIVPTTRAGNLVARVIRVVDGDTVSVSFLDGSTDTVRLLGVDTPEMFTANKAYEYGNITDTGCLDRWGDLATAFAVETLEGQMIDLVLDPEAGERGFYDRLLAYIVVDDQDFNAKLVEQGYARVYAEGTSSREADYLRLQWAAQAQELGLWECKSALPTPAPPGQECHLAYPDVCIPPTPPDLDCGEIAHRNFTVLPPDPQRFDRDRDGVG